jgi:hypothetical protein
VFLFNWDTEGNIHPAVQAVFNIVDNEGLSLLSEKEWEVVAFVLENPAIKN